LRSKIGVRLLTPSTRTGTPTDAGEQLIAHLGPALAGIRSTHSRFFLYYPNHKQQPAALAALIQTLEWKS
jgi:DNA-binding transcriptional LysR family regulator